MTEDCALSSELRVFLANITSEPGVYRMLDATKQVLYVGKASNLKKRVSSYFSKQDTGVKTRSLVSQIVSIEISVTRSETEALLLESSLIKSLRPKYNVVMRDDKSYPFIHISDDPLYPRIEIIRCKKKPEAGDYFGPYPNATAVRETLNVIQKVFKIRNCSNSYFNARSRPCLQYQINRCSAPCTQYILPNAYQQSITDAKRFLQGKSIQILEELARRMQEAVARLAFEEAAMIRDQIKKLRLVQESQGVVQLSGDADVIVLEARPGFACILCVHVRGGEIIGSDSFFPSVPKVGFTDESTTLESQVFSAFIAHYYIDMPTRIPALLLTDHEIEDKGALQTLFCQLRGRACELKTNARGLKARWLDFARDNLKVSIAKHISSASMISARYNALSAFLGLAHPISRMECFDVSHTQGEDTVASCVVFDEQGPCKRLYRRFNVTGITPGDDYAAMEQVLTRRFKRLNLERSLPDVVLIDGGKGQISIARRVLETLGVDGVVVLGIAKGSERKAGFERLILARDLQEHALGPDSKVLQLVQQIRDEAHRFAITGHRKKRQKRSFESSLEQIAGIGLKRRQALLTRFGGIKELARASMDEIAKVRGISAEMAARIYHHFRS